MSSDKINLDARTICDRQFNIDFKGYNMDEVDAFLDQVIADYESYEKMVQSLNEKISELERTNASLRAKLIEEEGKSRAMAANQQATAAQPAGSGTSVDILKRLSRLEEEVFSQKNSQE